MLRQTCLAHVLAMFTGASAGRDTFGTAWKGTKNGQKWQSGVEIDVFDHTCDDQCSMHHFWAGGSFKGYGDSILRYYVDGETNASVVIPFGLGLGNDQDAKQLDQPWSAGALFGKTGRPSGIFHNYHVPFGHDVRVTVQLGGVGLQQFWIILKGSSNMMPRIDGESLPAQARARTYINENVSVPVGGRLPLLASSAQNGAVLATVLNTHSWNKKTFLEGCIRAEEPGTGKIRSVMSSGTEDYFLGTYYFNEGQYANPVAGYTNIDTSSTRSSFTAYRVHDADPLYFQQGLNLTWRNGDPYMSCDLNHVNGQESVSTSTFAFAYEWPSSDELIA